MKKSIIIPCYNEINNIAKVIDKVLSKIEEGDNIIIVDDGSSDGTAQYLANLKNEKIKIILNSQNFGKGFAL
jgi:glycosyltransferase involved in cell wall biosynthesis